MQGLTTFVYATMWNTIMLYMVWYGNSCGNVECFIIICWKLFWYFKILYFIFWICISYPVPFNLLSSRLGCSHDMLKGAQRRFCFSQKGVFNQLIEIFSEKLYGTFLKFCQIELGVISELESLVMKSPLVQTRAHSVASRICWRSFAVPLHKRILRPMYFK